MRLHLDLIGGMAGDMTTAALLDAFPQHEAGVVASVAEALRGQPVACRLVDHHDGVLSGRRFEVEATGMPGVDDGSAPLRRRPEYRVAADRHRQAVPSLQTQEPSRIPMPRLEHFHAHDDPHPHEHEQLRPHAGASTHDHPPGGAEAAAPSHPHVPWRVVRASLEASALAPGVLRQALGIFGLLAEAEATVHGAPVDEVVFHEVGAWDSIADIVAAAHLIDAIGATGWTAGPVPLGGGRVRTAHGPMPVPAPATAILLEGFDFLDDGIAGERVTPTGAAILRHLCDGRRVGGPAGPAGRLVTSGLGFGSRRLPGISNCLRVLAFDDAPAATPAPASHRQLAVIEFEVDDQSAEDLAMGLEHLRAHPAIFDVVQMPVFGKKGRMMTSVRVLASATAAESAIEACFRETTTIGLRHRIVSGAALPRQAHEVELDGARLRVKSVDRPGGATAKTESDDVAALPGHAARAARRQQAERAGLARLREAGGESAAEAPTMGSSA